jgi:hypothetical protein
MKIDLGDLFAAISETYEMNGDKDPPSRFYHTVHANDQEPVNIIEPHYMKGPWIAGGACLRWYQNQPVEKSDIDVFCASAVQAQALIERIKSYGRFHVKADTENAVTIEYTAKGQDRRDSWTIQVITKRYYSSLQEIVDNFDITVCQLGTTGNEWILGNYTARDVRERNLRMILPLQPDAVKRLTKYWVYGYRPVPGLLEAIQNNPQGRWAFNPSEDYS